jgi:hypothetical protein
MGRAASVPERKEFDGLIRSLKDTRNVVRPGYVLVTGDRSGDLIRKESSQARRLTLGRNTEQVALGPDHSE